MLWCNCSLWYLPTCRSHIKQVHADASRRPSPSAVCLGSFALVGLDYLQSASTAGLWAGGADGKGGAGGAGGGACAAAAVLGGPG